MDEELVSRKEAASLTGMAYPTVAQWQKKRWLPSVRRGREVMIPRADLDLFIAKRNGKKGRSPARPKPSATPSRLLIVVPNTVRGEVVIVIGAA